jgi:ERO1-like protein alpha
LRNLYFLHLFVVQSLARGAPTLLAFEGLSPATRQLLEEVLTLSQSYAVPNESLHVFEKDSQQIEEFKAHFYSLSTVFDCIGCFRCRLWGKLQLKGLGAALRLLYDPIAAESLLHNDVVALVNLAHCLSDSVAAVAQLQPLLTNQLLDGSNRCVVYEEQKEPNPFNQFQNEL